MNVITKRIVSGGTIQYTGSLDKKNILLILGRNNFLKDEELIRSLVDALTSEKMTIVCYEHVGVTTAKRINLACDQFLSRHKWIPIASRNFLKMCLLVKYPKVWHYFYLAKMDSPKLVVFQVKQLRKYLSTVDASKNVFLLSRSASGRAAALVAEEPVVKKIICLGYPFKHLTASDEQERVRPLATISKPYLIVQGTQDVYGGREVLDRYTFSPNVSFSFVDADHDFLVSKVEWERVMMEVRDFIAIS
ncbi:MAG: hypothetical protein NTX72_03090 [Candidatus Uhrbacteria bacterium]|nr:hypothetical protein [Candidatus Uhrbacteria bacterium]